VKLAQRRSRNYETINKRGNVNKGEGDPDTRTTTSVELQRYGLPPCAAGYAEEQHGLTIRGRQTT
jgi:hypothetical protein